MVLLFGAGPGFFIGANPQGSAGMKTGHNFFSPHSALQSFKIFTFKYLQIKLAS